MRNPCGCFVPIESMSDAAQTGFSDQGLIHGPSTDPDGPILDNTEAFSQNPSTPPQTVPDLIDCSGLDQSASSYLWRDHAG